MNKPCHPHPQQIMCQIQHTPKLIKKNPPTSPCTILAPHTQICPRPQQQIPPPNTINLDALTFHTLGTKSYHAITSTKTTIRKGKWGQQAIKKHYLCQRDNPHGTTHQWQEEAIGLRPWEPLNSTNLTLSTQECNLDGDIGINKVQYKYTVSISTHI